MSQQKKKRKPNIPAKFRRVIMWFFFTVCLAVVPLIFGFFLRVYKSPGDMILSWKTLQDFFSPNGELLIVSSAIVGEGMADLFTRKIKAMPRAILGGWGILFIVATALLFGFISTTDIQTEKQQELVLFVSNWSFVFAFITGLFCKIVGRS